MMKLKDIRKWEEVMFGTAAEEAEEVTQAGPDALHGVGVNLADAIAVVIARPFALLGAMADGLGGSVHLGQSVVGAPLIGIDGRPVLCGCIHHPFQSFLVGVGD